MYGAGVVVIVLWGWFKCMMGEGNGNPLQYSCRENSVDRGAWWAAVHRVAWSRTRLKRLSMQACIGEGNGHPFQHPCLENPRERGAWWAAPSMGLHRVGHDWSDLVAAASILHLLCTLFLSLLHELHLRSSSIGSWRLRAFASKALCRGSLISEHVFPSPHRVGGSECWAPRRAAAGYIDFFWKSRDYWIFHSCLYSH